MSKATFTSELTRRMKEYKDAEVANERAIQREELLRQELAVAEIDTRDTREKAIRTQRALLNFIRDEGD